MTSLEKFALLGIPVFVSGLITLVLGHLSKNSLSKKAEKLKFELNNQAEMFKAELKQQAIEHQTKFSKLHEKRALVIDELYKKLVKAIALTLAYITPILWEGTPSEDERKEKAVEKYRDLLNFFAINEIYFDEIFCSKMGDYLDLNHKILYEFLLKDKKPKRKSIGRDWVDIFEEFKTESESLKNDLKNEFREMLDVPKRSSSAETSPDPKPSTLNP